MPRKKTVKVEGLGIPRRVRNNHGSMLVTIPPDLAVAIGVTFGDYVMVRLANDGEALLLTKIE